MNKKKICLLGMFGSGKTSLVRRFVYNSFDEKYLSTIGVNISQKLLPPIENDRGKEVELDFLLWDIEGADQSFNIPYNYYAGSSGAIIVADLTRDKSVEDTPKLVEKFLETVPNGKVIVAANKVDLAGEDNERVKKLKKYCAEEDIPVVITSAKTEINVDHLFIKLGELVVKGK